MDLISGAEYPKPVVKDTFLLVKNSLILILFSSNTYKSTMSAKQ